MWCHCPFAKTLAKMYSKSTRKIKGGLEPVNYYIKKTLDQGVRSRKFEVWQHTIEVTEGREGTDAVGPMGPHHCASLGATDKSGGHIAPGKG